MRYPQNTNYIDYPSTSVRKREHEKWLATQGCAECGEDDPSVLEEVPYPSHDCPARQSPPPGRGMVLCDEHVAPMDELYRRAKEKRLDDLEPGEAYVAYDCGWWQRVGQPVEEYAGQHALHPPQAPIECVCGADIRDIHYNEP